jgi:hypothetical protein
MKAIAVLAGALIFASFAPSANAAMQLAFQVVGVNANPVVCGAAGSNTAYTVPPTSTLAICTGTVPTPGSAINDDNVSISFFDGSSNSPGGAPNPNSNQAATTVAITNTGATTETLNLWVWAPGFTSPTAPPGFDWVSNLQITSVSGKGTVGMNSCVDTDYPGPTSTNTCPTLAGNTATDTGPQLANDTLSYSGAATVPTDTVSEVVSAGVPSPFTLEEMITVTLSAGAQVNLATSQVLTPVPEPMSIALLGGVLILVSRAMRRKRNVV